MEEQKNNPEELAEETAASETETVETVEITEETPVTEAAPVAENPAVENLTEEKNAEAVPEAPVKKATPGKITMAVCAVIVLASVLIALVYSGRQNADVVPAETAVAQDQTGAYTEPTIPADGNPDDVTCKGSYSVSDEDAIAAGETVVATIGEHSLTNSQLQVYYWMEVQNFLGTYGSYAPYFGLNYAQPLDTQLEEEGMTWQQYFLDTALNNWQQVLAMSQMAKDAGLPMSEENVTYLEGLDAYLEEVAAGNNVSVEELMVGNFGPGADKEDYRYFQELYMSGVPYYQAKLAEMVPTEEILSAYFDEHATEYADSGVTKDSKFVDVRHILVQIKGGTTAEDGATTYSDEDWAACEAEAQAILDTWLAGEKTEDSFATLATEKTEDPGSQQSGGLYQQVYPGQMVQPFNDWCFDEARAYGDYGLVKTDYGYHVMYFVSSEPQWPYYAESDWLNEQSANLLEEVVSKYPMEVSFGDIVLGVVDMG